MLLKHLVIACAFMAAAICGVCNGSSFTQHGAAPPSLAAFSPPPGSHSLR